ncbi:type II toxin-antitoxin system prevent-host-death family antitoxin [Paenibacillus antri]|uniref:Type II toxin-antitoxin system prevent-host-death family antitoxin n=1 Tax=Paenibacillus antri TaxID=2582848 RepID=A0A5R9GE78_9BACL|nr:type II toxin-antitoxin system prevent-host-death family antitoxin [Paenibacillus antri]TLS54081.1 type II toxin-antitoxin system prevent-host-death family antitoxin [Paenibacillus antri]
MEVSSTEVQNNFGKYLLLAAQEDVIVTRNGRAIAKLTAVEERSRAGIVAERGVPYDLIGNYGGRKASFEEFLSLRKGKGDERFEYIDGEIYNLASPKTDHQVALMELAVMFHRWSEGRPCRPFVAPYDIELRRSERQDQANVVQPDLMMICDLEEHLSDDGYYKGVPSLLVEILSESTRGKDMIRKCDLYMKCGVREYWIVNPFAKEVTVFRFADEEIADNATYRLGESARSFIFEGLIAEVSRLFR